MRVGAAVDGGEGVAGGGHGPVDDDLRGAVVAVEAHGVAGGEAERPVVGERRLDQELAAAPTSERRA